MTASLARNRGMKRDWTPDIDARLAAVYTGGARGALTRLALDTGIPHNTLANRASAQLNLPRLRKQKRRSWTCQEDAILIDWGCLPAKVLVGRLAKAGFQRSEAAIRDRRQHLRRAGHRLDEAVFDYSVPEVAAGMGCNDVTVCRWITSGKLKAKALLSDSAAGKYYRIRAEDLRRFCLTHTGDVSRVRPDLIWYTDLIGYR